MIHAVLTIDDVASENTPALVEYLRKNKIPALLFGLGENIEKYYDEAIYALQEGFIIGNHTYSHPSCSALSMEEVVEEIEKCEKVLDDLYLDAGVERHWKPFRFPYGDKGGDKKDAIQSYLADHGFHKVKDTQITYPWWHERGLDRDIDTFWTYGFREYDIRPGSSYTKECVMRDMDDPNPFDSVPLFDEGAHHLLLLHAHDETEAMWPGYYRTMLGHLLDRGVVFEKPEFFEAKV